MTSRHVRYWRRLDAHGLERLEWEGSDAGIAVTGEVIWLGGKGLSLTYRWLLDTNWRTLSVDLARRGPDRSDSLLLERAGSGWRVDGAIRPDLAGVEEADLSASPFCNMLPFRWLPPEPGAELVLDAALIDAATLAVVRSGQRYVRRAKSLALYTDLGVSAGFEAEITFDDQGFVLTYGQLFEQLRPLP